MRFLGLRAWSGLGAGNCCDIWSIALYMRHVHASISGTGKVFSLIISFSLLFPSRVGGSLLGRMSYVGGFWLEIEAA